MNESTAVLFYVKLCLFAQTKLKCVILYYGGGKIGDRRCLFRIWIKMVRGKDRIDVETGSIVGAQIAGASVASVLAGVSVDTVTKVTSVFTADQWEMCH